MNNLVFKISDQHPQGFLDRYEASLQSQFTQAVAIVEPLLAINRLVEIEARAILNPNMSAVGATCQSPSLVLLDINLASPKVEKDISNNEPLLLMAHELHHQARIGGPGYGATLGERLVSEGLAVEFERQTGRRGRIPHAPPLNSKQRDKLLYEAHEGLYHPCDGIYSKPSVANPFGRGRPECPHYLLWFSGHNLGGVRQAGYRLGHHIVQNYQRANGNPTAAQLVHTPADEILKATFG